MIMSRAEIVAAARALRRDARGRSQSGAFPDGDAPAVAAALVSDCAAQVRADHSYRWSLVTRLQNRIRTGTYTVPADAIAEQLLGRLLAAALTT